MIPPEELADMRITADNLRKTDMNDASMYIDKLFAHIDEQASQIATLKAICIKERRMRAKEVEEWAASQLAQEYPEITWEEKK